jgi:hypothetical protein
MSLSIPEIIQQLLIDSTDSATVAPGGITTGPCSPKQIKDGAIGILPVGQPKNERYTPLQRMALALRCHGATVTQAELIGIWAYGILKERRRQVLDQPSSSERFLVHFVTVSGGPNIVQGPVQDTWESGLTLEVLAGTTPVGAPNEPPPP